MIYADLEFPDNANDDNPKEKKDEDITKSILLALSSGTEE